MRFLLVRHGETVWNAEKRFGGHADVPLNETGLEQAEKTAGRLQNENISKAFCSDLMRARITAQEIMKFHDIPLVERTDLREMNFGSWEGLTYKDIVEQYPEQSKAWIEDGINTSGPGGESLKNFYDRIGQVFQGLKGIASEEDTILIVAHSGVVQSILSRELLGSVDGFWKFKVDNGGVVILEYSHGFPVLSALNV